MIRKITVLFVTLYERLIRYFRMLLPRIMVPAVYDKKSHPYVVALEDLSGIGVKSVWVETGLREYKSYCLSKITHFAFTVTRHYSQLSGVSFVPWVTLRGTLISGRGFYCFTESLFTYECMGRLWGVYKECGGSDDTKFPNQFEISSKQREIVNEAYREFMAGLYVDLHRACGTGVEIRYTDRGPSVAWIQQNM